MTEQLSTAPSTSHVCAHGLCSSLSPQVPCVGPGPQPDSWIVSTAPSHLCQRGNRGSAHSGPSRTWFSKTSTLKIKTLLLGAELSLTTVLGWIIHQPLQKEPEAWEREGQSWRFPQMQNRGGPEVTLCSWPPGWSWQGTRPRINRTRLDLLIASFIFKN